MSGEYLWLNPQEGKNFAIGNFSCDIYRAIPNGKVLAHLGFRSWVLFVPLTDLSAFLVFLTSSPQQGANNRLIFDFFCRKVRGSINMNFSWDIYRATPLSKQKSNIIADIWHPGVGLRCRNTTRHISQLTICAIHLSKTPSGQELCRWEISMGYL
jgi:hypothetical protein